MTTSNMAAATQVLPVPHNELEAQKRRRRLLHLPIRTLSFSSRNTSSSPTSSSYPVHGGTSRRTTATALTVPSPPPQQKQPQAPTAAAAAATASKESPRSSTSKFFRPSALKRLFTPSTNSNNNNGTTTSQKKTPPSPAPEPPQRPPLSRLREASSSILTYHRAKILDRDLRSERYCKIPLTQWNLDSLQTELAELKKLRLKTSRQSGSPSLQEKGGGTSPAAENDGDEKEKKKYDDDGVRIVDEGTVCVLVRADTNNDDGRPGVDGTAIEMTRSESSPSRQKVEESVMLWLDGVVA